MNRKTLPSTLMALVMVLALPISVFAQSTTDFRNDMRKLWEDHITWTRLYIVSAVAGLPNKDATAKRLLQNQTDIGNAIKPFYGDAAGAKLTALLKDHILIATEVIDAVKADDAAKKNETSNRWYANADEIAVFLSEANPKSWPLSEMKMMMKHHLDHTASEVVNHVKKDWSADIADYDKVHGQILKMADMLSSGIIKQYPDKLKTASR